MNTERSKLENKVDVHVDEIRRVDKRWNSAIQFIVGQRPFENNSMKSKKREEKNKERQKQKKERNIRKSYKELQRKK